MKRFDFHVGGAGHEYDDVCRMVEAPEGEFITFLEHINDKGYLEVENRSLRFANKILEKKIERMEQQIKERCIPESGLPVMSVGKSQGLICYRFKKDLANGNIHTRDSYIVKTMSDTEVTVCEAYDYRKNREQAQQITISKADFTQFSFFP